MIALVRLIIFASPREEEINQSFCVFDGCTIGNSMRDSFTLQCPELSEGHIQLTIKEGKVELRTRSPELLVDVNKEKVHRCILSPGDMINVGEYVLLIADEDTEQSKAFFPKENIVQSTIESRHGYYDSSKHVLESFGNVEKSQGRLATLYKIANAISGILNLDHLLKNLLEILLEEFPADRGFIMLVKGPKKRLVPAAVISKKNEGEPQISKKIVEEVFSTKESILCENILEDTRFHMQQSLIRNKVKSAMCVPLIRNREILGLIHLDSQEKGKFSSDDLDLLTKVAMHAAIVIENAWFYKIRQEFHYNLLALAQATQSLSSYLREDLIIRDATFYASQIFRAQKSFLFLKKDKELVLLYASGVSPEKWAHIPVPATLWEVINHHRSLLYEEVEKIPKDVLPLVIPGNSFMAVPISIFSEKNPEEPCMGVLCVAEKGNGEPFVIEDQQLLSILAAYTAIALSNAKFYEELKNKEQEIAQWNSELERRVNERTEELKSTQSQLIQSEKMAAIGLLAAGVAHEFNNIMASMYGFAQMAKKNPQLYEKLANIVISQSKRGVEITENLLSFSKQRDESLELSDVTEIIERVLNLTAIALENEGIKVVRKFSPIPKTLLNVNKIQQVFLNIIINARQAIEKNGTITITISLLEEKKIQIAFQDTGKGIALENLKKIFEPFYTTKGSFGGGSQPGTGIGLSLCYNIVRQHKGTISVESELGKGTTFTVILPVREEIQTEKYRETSRFFVRPRFGKRVLIITNDSNIHGVFVIPLEEKGIQVHIAGTHLEAVENCKKERFDFIFFDMDVSTGRGAEALTDLQRLEPHSMLILIASTTEGNKFLSYQKEADKVLKKPFTPENLYAILGIPGFKES